MKKENVVICPPCGENVALATKRGANKVNLFLPLLPRLTAVLPPQGREITANGFTLIELLVVVLIIGILAAVAVPQYKVAVEKSRLTETLTIAKNIKDAQERYYLEHGSYTKKIEDLDISFPDTSGYTITSPNGITMYLNGSNYVYGINKIETITLKLNYTHHPEKPNLRYCFAKKDDNIANQICKSLGGNLDEEDVNCARIGKCNTYILQ